MLGFFTHTCDALQALESVTGKTSSANKEAFRAAMVRSLARCWRPTGEPALPAL